MATTAAAGVEAQKSKRPSGSRFKQQKLPAWQPIMTAGSVMPTFFVISVFFIPIGIGLLLTSNAVDEYEIDYTQCQSVADPGKKCADVLADAPGTGCTCRVSLRVERDMEPDVFVYYELSNFYQNHRRYVKSRDDQQLRGQDVHTLDDDCQPFRTVEVRQDGNTTTKMPVAPCGAVANSMFNDTITLKLGDNKVPVLRTGIAWNSDKNVKFRNPEDVDSYFSPTKHAKPPNWAKPANQLDPDDANNNGFLNEDFIVWMRTAALPVFRKLYRRVDHSNDDFKEKLPKGNYTLDIEYNYPVTVFDGGKKVIVSNTSWLGGKNPFLGIAYITVGSICFLLGIVFLFIHLKWGKTPEESTNINQRTT